MCRWSNEKDLIAVVLVSFGYRRVTEDQTLETDDPSLEVSLRITRIEYERRIRLPDETKIC